MRRRLNRQAVIEAAIAYADEHGLDALTVSALARHLGMAPPSLYAHVPGGLRELRAAICVRGLLDIADRCRRAATGRAGADALRALAHAQRAYARDHPARYAATAFGVDHYQDDDVRRAADEAAAVAADILATCAPDGPARLHAARGIRSAVQGFCALEAAGVFALAVPADDSFAWLVDALVARIVPAAVPGRAG
ncbi:transcriptional regulator [Sphaerisporangium rufum]|uniref:Transcriptional regulator n=1 Tax=Sphaerisporangium rufum TaxID=1381558 RepID=A0A919V1S7_9ACTN|nr:TetR-like C-terminal domain-containing protein [Sphaerisporangium rufum]GII78942.1 transcriptional regulator [Sphaerisporangium rufum]